MEWSSSTTTKSAGTVLAPKRPAEGFYPDKPDRTDVASLRRELIAYYDSPLGIGNETAACAIGRISIVPDVSGAESQARVLCAGEVERLKDAELWFASSETIELAGAAYPGYPAGPMHPWSLPSPSGLIMFESPLLCRPVTELEVASARSLYPQGAQIIGAEDPIYICAASWGPYSPTNWLGLEGRWIRFYAARGSAMRWWTPAQRRYASIYPRMVGEHDVAVLIKPEVIPAHLAYLPDEHFDIPATDVGTAPWARMLLCLFEILAQDHLVTEHSETVPRPERRRHQREGLAEPKPVRVLSLHRSAEARDAHSASAALNAGTTHYKHRFPVRGHWRNQWYAATQTHKRRYIAPYWKGPDGAPLLLGEKVNLF